MLAAITACVLVLLTGERTYEFEKGLEISAKSKTDSSNF